MIMKYKNKTIRCAKLGDSLMLLNWYNDGKIMEHAGFPNGLNENIENINNKIKSCSAYTSQLFILEYKDISIGEMHYRNIGNLSVELGIKICDFTKHDQGLGKIYLSMMIDFLLFELQYKKIVVNANLNNLRAQHVYEALGFIKTKVSVDSWTNQLGKLQSSVQYELNKNNFINFMK